MPCVNSGTLVVAATRAMQEIAGLAGLAQFAGWFGVQAAATSCRGAVGTVRTAVRGDSLREAFGLARWEVLTASTTWTRRAIDKSRPFRYSLAGYLEGLRDRI